MTSDLNLLSNCTIFLKYVLANIYHQVRGWPKSVQHFQNDASKALLLGDTYTKVNLYSFHFVAFPHFFTINIIRRWTFCRTLPKHISISPHWVPRFQQRPSHKSRRLPGRHIELFLRYFRTPSIFTKTALGSPLSRRRTSATVFNANYELLTLSYKYEGADHPWTSTRTSSATP